ncbi:peptidyl-prolyl cis-trans isomerase [Bacillus sp. BRMEA1]|uniref:peptidyl-prolyl cis-trans isomerase n=1 Tax=Neobacillus endophyticus TaxID=2738405 RepID=UPI001563A998|nr:peptidyl-prolyl cis-trans isomerase [Neobacillus endophyticus]NRD78738.1 peptidyl-prolyl cis-trans isomerase [Neobacillus endophyticus]
MENIMTISGNVNYPITLDPATWIFDDRRIDLTTCFVNKEMYNADEEYTKAASKHWDREIMEGAIFPPTLKTEKKFEKEKMITGTFGIHLKPFLKNSEPKNDAVTLVIHATDAEYEYPLSKAGDLILKFSEDGKPLKTDGPVHVYFADGSNQHNPIKNVHRFTVK